MTAAPLWLIQNVRLADRDGLWQIAIDKGRFGAITPMGEAHDESYEVLNARGGLAIPPFIEPHIHLDTTQTARAVSTSLRLMEWLLISRS